LGFTFVNSIKILGMEIDRDLENLDSNFTEIHGKITRSIAYWKRYNLSLPGRINIIKSLLVSLLNYLGCFLMPKTATLNSIQRALDDFAIGTLKVARNRVCLAVDEGGLGLFKLDDFLASQQCTWVLKANISRRDNWRVDLRTLTDGNCLSLSHRIVNPNKNPILFGLASAFERLRVCHDSQNENFLKATVLNHPMFFRGARNKLTLDPEYLECEGDLVTRKNLAALPIEKMFGQNGLITRVELRILWGVDLNLTGYANLCRSLNHFVNRLSVNRMNDGSSVSLREDMSVKNPGKKIRKKFLKKRQKPFDLGKQTTVTSFFRITGLVYTGNELFSAVISLWNTSGFTNRTKTFIFKFYNNILGINTRTFHFAANPTRSCFFCTKKTPPVITDESFIHLFHSCSVTENWHKKFEELFLPELDNNDEEHRKKLWLLGTVEDDLSLFLGCAILTFQFCIWESKLKKVVPSFNSLKAEFEYLFRNTIHFNSELTKSGIKLNYELCRYFLGGRRGLRDGEE
jgi:hypothetical protein